MVLLLRSDAASLTLGPRCGHSGPDLHWPGTEMRSSDTHGFAFSDGETVNPKWPWVYHFMLHWVVFSLHKSSPLKRRKLDDQNKTESYFLFKLSQQMLSKKFRYLQEGYKKKLSPYPICQFHYWNWSRFEAWDHQFVSAAACTHQVLVWKNWSRLVHLWQLTQAKFCLKQSLIFTLN